MIRRKLLVSAIPTWSVAPSLAFSLTAGLALLPACSPSGMYCLVTNGAFAADFTQIEGTQDCLGLEVDKVFFNYYLNTNEKAERGDPKSPRIAMSFARAIDAYSAAHERVEALRGYAACPNPEPGVNTQVDDAFLKHPYFSLSNFDGYLPDAQERCFANQFAPAVLALPALGKVPACPGLDGYEQERPPLEAMELGFRLDKVQVKNSPASQGIWVQGVMEYNQAGCSATYSFRAIKPAMKCATTEQCNGPESSLSEDVRAAGVVCVGATNPTTEDGLCVLAPNAAAG